MIELSMMEILEQKVLDLLPEKTLQAKLPSNSPTSTVPELNLPVLIVVTMVPAICAAVMSRKRLRQL
jgi:hypothetical protein